MLVCSGRLLHAAAYKARLPSRRAPLETRRERIGTDPLKAAQARRGVPSASTLFGSAPWERNQDDSSSL